MKRKSAVACALLGLLSGLAPAQEALDQLSDALTFSSRGGNVRTRLSGLLDLDGYRFPQPVPGIIDTRYRNYFFPRLSLFVDSQLGPALYLFVQSRVDRSFDGGDHGLRIRLDEYSLRWTPWEDGRFTLAAGKFTTIVGSWNVRHLSWDNPFINAPLAYEDVTFAADMEIEDALAFGQRVVNSATKYEYLPIVWGPSYASGVSISGRLGDFEYAAELKNASLSSRPRSWDLADTNLDHPSIHARLAWRPSPMWRLGLSAGQGPYLREEALPDLPAGRGLADYRQRVLAQDVSFAWRHWQVWAEAFQARFEIPFVGNADCFSYYLEAKYKFAPQAYAAVRWNQQLYDEVPDGLGGWKPWKNDLWRVDTCLAYRPTAHSQIKLQYSLDEGRRASGGYSHTIAGQLTIRF